MTGVTSEFSIQNAQTLSPNLLSKSEAKAELKSLKKEMASLQKMFFAEKKNALLCVFQAMDAAGKDGTIRSVFSGFNPAGIQCSAFSKPTRPELHRDYLWRVHQRIPPKGMIGIFNRSHYEEVITVRVFPQFLSAQSLPELSLTERINQRFNEIRAFESLLSNSGTRILKFFLNVGKQEQFNRLLSRMENPEKNWKHDGHDLNCRDRWDDFMQAYQDAIRATNTQNAPWYCIPADNKANMRVAVAKIIRDTLLDMTPQFPQVDDKSRIQIVNDRNRLLGKD